MEYVLRLFSTYSCSLASIVAWFVLPPNPLVLLEVVAQGMSLFLKEKGIK
jgi:hypothetical protein